MFAVVKNNVVQQVYPESAPILQEGEALLECRDRLPAFDNKYQECLPPASAFTSPESYMIEGGIVYRVWRVIDSWEAVRRERKRLLDESDKTQQLDSANRFDVAAWAAYRQQIVELNETYPTPADVVWPAQPQ